MTGIVWNVSLKQPDGTGPGEGQRGSGIKILGDVGLVRTIGEHKFYAYDLNTGAQLWTKELDYVDMGTTTLQLPNGLHPSWDAVTRRVHAYDIKTGNEIWVSDPIGEYPWGSQAYPWGLAYDHIYFGAYDGRIHAIDVTTGKTTWSSDYAGDTTETPFGTWAFYSGMVIADGKIYQGGSEHTATQPRIRGNRFFCIDAHTGKFLWNISGAIQSRATQKATS
jgi:outer membrane protein assembly factor BamB